MLRASFLGSWRTPAFLFRSHLHHLEVPSNASTRCPAEEHSARGNAMSSLCSLGCWRGRKLCRPNTTRSPECAGPEQSFRLLDLPPELHLRVYGFFVGGLCQVKVPRPDQSVKSPGWPNHVVKKDCFSMLKTSSIIDHEMHNIVYDRLLFVVEMGICRTPFGILYRMRITFRFRSTSMVPPSMLLTRGMATCSGALHLSSPTSMVARHRRHSCLIARLKYFPNMYIDCG